MNPVKRERLYCTHLRALIIAVLQTEGPILECGIGHYSTPVLEALAQTMDRELVHVEHDSGWAKQIQPRGKLIRIRAANVFDTSPLRLHSKWGVVLLDQGPTGTERWPWAIAALPITSLVVLHDAELQDEGIYQYRTRILPHVHHWCLDTRLFPHTMLCSQTIDVSEWFDGHNGEADK